MAEVFKYALHIQGGIDAAAWWLVAAAAVLALALLVNPVTLRPSLDRFRRRSVLGKIATVVVFCALVWRGGAKNDGDRGGDGSRGDAETRRAGGSSFSSTADADAINCVPPNPVNPVNPVKNNLRDSAPPREIYSSTNFPLSVTAILPDNSNRVVNVGLAWTSNAFDCANSRYVQSVMSTNLLVREWFPGGEYLAPTGTNACEIAISSNAVPAVSRDAFSAACGSALFFAFGLDADSDADGLLDIYEALVTLTDPFLADTDLDGLDDGEEISLGTDPNLRDTDGDGMPDGAARSTSCTRTRRT